MPSIVLPENILNSLPNQAAAGSLPQAMLDALPNQAAAGSLPQAVLDALPAAGALPKRISDALVAAGALPDNTQDAMPTYPPTIERIFPNSDTLAQPAWAGWDGSMAVAFPNIYTTIDEFPFDDTDYAELRLDINAGGIYNFTLTAQVSSIALPTQEVRFTTIRSGTGVYNADFSIANNPGPTFKAIHLTNAQLRTNGGINTWSFFLTAGEIAARTTQSVLVGISLGGGPPGAAPDSFKVGALSMFITLP